MKKQKRNSVKRLKRPVRIFDKQWLDKKTWLQYDQEANVMKCSLCVEKYAPIIDSDPSKSPNMKKQLSICKLNRYNVPSIRQQEPQPIKDFEWMNSN